MTASEQTVALQRVVDHAHISARDAVIPAGIYHIAPPGLNLYSGTRLRMTGVTLLAENGDTYNGALVNMDNCDDVVIIGGTQDGQKALHPTARVNGINILNSNNVTVSGVRVVNCPSSTLQGQNQGDGIYIANSTNILLDGITLDGNVRQGVSITGGQNIQITNSHILNTSGSAPGSGVDVEPNVGSTVNGVSFVDLEISGNKNGITLDAAHGAVTGIELLRCALSDNRGHGISGSGSLGSVDIDDSQFIDNALRQVFFEPADSVTINNIEATGSPAGYEGIYIEANVLSSITGSRIHDNGNAGLHVTGTGQHTIANNVFWSNATGNFNRPAGATIENNQELNAPPA